MRVLIINPNSDQETADVLSKTAQSFLEDRGEFDVVSMRTAPKLVVTYEDQAASAMELIVSEKDSGIGRVGQLVWRGGHRVQRNERPGLLEKGGHKITQKPISWYFSL